MTAAEFDRELDEALARAEQTLRVAADVRFTLAALAAPERLWRP
jgi:hypothetical protein